MDLETLVKSNPIVQKIGVIEEPFKPKDVTTKYPIIVLDLVKLHKGQEALDKVVDSIISNHLPSIEDKGKFLDYVNNEHNWVNGFLYILFFEYGKEALQIEDFYKFVGRTIANPKFLQVAAGESFGIDFIYRKVAELNPNYNNAIDLEYDKNLSKNGYTVIRRKTKEGYRNRYLDKLGEELSAVVMRNDDLLTQGILESVPRAPNPENDFAKLVKEPSCESKGDDCCEYHLEWSQRPYSTFVPYNVIKGIGKAITTGIIYNLPPVKKLVDNIFRMEVVIQQKTEEVEQRTDQLVHQSKLVALGRISADTSHAFNTPVEASKMEMGPIREGIPDLIYLHREVDQIGFEDPLKSEFYELIDHTIKKAPNVGYLDDLVIVPKAEALHENLKGEYNNITVDMCEEIVTMGYDNEISKLEKFLHIDDPSKVIGILRKAFDYSLSIANVNENLDIISTKAKSFSEHTRRKKGEISYVNLNEKILSTLALYDETIKKLGISVETDFDENLDLVECDVVGINDVLSNIVNNAIYALEKAEGEKRLKFKTDGVNGYVRVGITDTGIGIPPENKERIYDPFFTTKRVGEGTGLGLSIALNIMQDHKGFLNHTSKPSDTTFELKLPVKYQGKA